MSDVEDFDPELDGELTDDELMDPIERQTLELLAETARNMQQAVVGLQAVVERLGQLIQVSAAPREITATGSSGRQLHGISRIKG